MECGANLALSVRMRAFCAQAPLALADTSAGKSAKGIGEREESVGGGQLVLQPGSVDNLLNEQFVPGAHPNVSIVFSAVGLWILVFAHRHSRMMLMMTVVTRQQGH